MRLNPEITDQRPTRQLRVAAALMLSALPFGLVITVINFVAIAQRLDFAARQGFSPILEANPRFSGEAVLRSAERNAWGHALWVALFFGCAAAVFGGLLWWLRRDRWRRPRALLVPGGFASAIYWLSLVLVFLVDPARVRLTTSYEDVPDSIPGWYLPALGTLLALAATTQLAALVLLARTGRAAAEPASAMSSGRIRILLPLLLAPAFALAFAGLYHLGIWSLTREFRRDPLRLGQEAEPDIGRAVTSYVAIHQETVLLTSTALGLATFVTIACLLWAHYSLRPAAGAVCGVFSVPYLLGLFAARLVVIDFPALRVDDGVANALQSSWPSFVMICVLIGAGVALIGFLIKLTARFTQAREGPPGR